MPSREGLRVTYLFLSAMRKLQQSRRPFCSLLCRPPRGAWTARSSALARSAPLLKAARRGLPPRRRLGQDHLPFTTQHARVAPVSASHSLALLVSFVSSRLARRFSHLPSPSPLAPLNGDGGKGESERTSIQAKGSHHLKRSNEVQGSGALAQRSLPSISGGGWQPKPQSPEAQPPNPKLQCRRPNQYLLRTNCMGVEGALVLI